MDLKRDGSGDSAAKITAAPSRCYAFNGPTSWLDDVVVIAVKVDGDKSGMNSTNLTYTLTSSENAFN